MNISNILNLFKYDPATQGALTFNIEQALNQNWDKIVALLGKVLMSYDERITYAENDLCASGGKVYQSKVSSNTGNAVTNTTYWKDLNNATDTEITALNEALSNVIKKDGSVQMTGALKTSGINGQQIINGNSGVVTWGTDYYLTSNCYHDGTNWRYSSNGKASTFKISGALSACVLTTFAGGAKDTVCAADETYTGAMLTNKTGLPLTGGVLTGSVTLGNNGALGLKGSGKVGVYMTTVNDTQMLVLNELNGNGDFKNFRALSLRALNHVDADSLMLGKTVNGVSTLYKIYGEHNITVSTLAPTSTLPNGAIHNVY